MFKKVLIANRGEIAVRVIQACRELGVTPVAVFSEADSESRHVKTASESWKLTGAPNTVYLDADQILEIAVKSGAQAVHPGYGFLAENSEFAAACEKAGVVFIGPKPDVISKMGSKVESRRVMEKAGVPVVPGTTDPVVEPDAVKELGTRYGYPIAIKASAGGGGRGLRVIRKPEDVENALNGAQREGASYFGSDEVYVEKYLERTRHIEVQVIGDNAGNVIHLFERDCSSQRRHQKLLEETPAARLDAKLKKSLLDAAVKGTKALGYTSAGTLEFLVSGDDFYFLEMNTRVQVEHPITEMTTGVDIVKEQIRIAAGENLSVRQEQIEQKGHSIECRINAEDPSKNFMPNPGTILSYQEPQHPWVRVDSACYSGYTVQPFYDSLLAKVVVWGKDRQEAIARMRLALTDLEIDGVATTTPFHLALLDDPTFQAGEAHTAYVEKEMMKSWKDIKEKYEKKKSQSSQVEVSIDARSNGRAKSGRGPTRTYEVVVDQRVFNVEVTGTNVDQQTIVPATSPTRKPRRQRNTASKTVASDSGEIRSAMHGLVKEILVNKGAKVEDGQRLIVFEAMKMESDIVACKSGTVSSIKVSAGETVDSDSLLLTIE